MPEEQPAKIKDLIVAAAEGAADGVRKLQELGIPIKLQEFEIEVNYSCSTELIYKGEDKWEMNFYIFKAEFSATTTFKRTVTYGLKVRFVFTGKSEKEETGTGPS